MGYGPFMTSIVIGYDGSLDARRAIEVAGGLFGGHRATVVTAWHFPVAAVDTPMPSMDEPEGIALDEQLEAERNARNMVEEGVALARAAGLNAEPQLLRAVGVSDIARSLLDVAEQRGADLVIVGRRGVSRIKAMMLGSVSDASLRDGRRPVLVVPRGDNSP